LPDLLSLAAPRRLVILFDEMEVAKARDPQAPAQIASALMPSAGFRGKRPFIGIVWGRALGRGQAVEVPSPWKDFHPEPLKLFSPEENKAAVEQPVSGAYGWGEDAVERVWELTSGHPLFTAAVGAAVHKNKR